MDKMNWVNEREEELKKESAEGYFDIAEGENRIQLLTHCAPLPLKWTGTKYEPAVEGDTNVSIKGVCWVLHDGKVKQAKLPYTVVKAVKALMEDPDYAFEEFPMPRVIKITAKNAGTKEVEYSVIPSPKEAPVSSEVLTELATKPTPEDIIEKIKGKPGLAAKPDDETVADKAISDAYTEGTINPEDIPF